MKKLILFTLLVAGSSNCKALQSNNTIDSLKNIIQSGNDTSKALAYIRWGEEHYQSHPDTALVLWNNAVKISGRSIRKELDTITARAHYEILATAYNNIAYIYIMKGYSDSCISYYDSTKMFLEKTGNKEGIGNYYLGMGYIYQQKGNYALALDQYNSAREISEQINNKTGIAMGAKQPRIFVSATG